LIMDERNVVHRQRLGVHLVHGHAHFRCGRCRATTRERGVDQTRRLLLAPPPSSPPRCGAVRMEFFAPLTLSIYTESKGNAHL
jgi:hypothetical protein